MKKTQAIRIRRTWPRTDPLPLKRGERAVVRIRNMSMEAHSMHLHG